VRKTRTDDADADIVEVVQLKVIWARFKRGEGAIFTRERGASSLGATTTASGSRRE